MLRVQPTTLPQEEQCPVPENVLGQLYTANALGLDVLIASVPVRTRAMLALYCYPRGHLRALGLTVATRCEELDLEEIGGQAGLVLFKTSREAPTYVAAQSHYQGRRKVTLSTGPIKSFIQDDELDVA